MKGRGQTGFSLLEMLASVSITLVISASLLMQIAAAHRSYTNEQTRNAVIWQGRTVVDQMVRELRMAGYPAKSTYAAAVGLTPSNSNLVAATFLTAASTRVVFEADLDGNGVVERVEYRLNGTTLERSAVSKNADGTVPATQYKTLAVNVNNGSAPIFNYATDPLSTATPPANTSGVRIALQLKTAQRDPKNGRYGTFVFQGMAYRQNPDH